METTKTETTRFWFFNGNGTLFVSLDLASFDEARQTAARINKDGPHSTMGYIEIISDARVPAHGRVTTAFVPARRRAA